MCVIYILAVIVVVFGCIFYMYSIFYSFSIKSLRLIRFWTVHIERDIPSSHSIHTYIWCHDLFVHIFQHIYFYSLPWKYKKKHIKNKRSIGSKLCDHLLFFFLSSFVRRLLACQFRYFDQPSNCRAWSVVCVTLKRDVVFFPFFFLIVIVIVFACAQENHYA